MRALQQLPIDLQMAIELYYWEELSVDEVGAALENDFNPYSPGLASADRDAVRDYLKAKWEID